MELTQNTVSHEMFVLLNAWQ